MFEFPGTVTSAPAPASPPAAELPLITGYAEGTTQWRAERLQVVNWGGFHGYHPIDFAPGATLISGASGTGKSTILDAYIALMMPSTVPFNGASNDATTGRARGADQRNILTYLRGKRDSSQDKTSGTVTDQVLRGATGPVWGAIAMTFADDSTRRFTAMRVYYAPHGAQRAADVTTRMFTVNGPFDLRDLAEFADSRFDPRTLRARFTGLTYHDGPGKFSDSISTRLGIGAGGDGDNALRLLARIQAGHQVKTVDALYKQMVLERPVTYQAADRALDQFQSLDQSYRDLETDGDKERTLRRIGELHEEYRKSSERADQLDRFGVSREGPTAFRLWELRTEYRLLTEAESANKADREQVRTALAQAKADAAHLAGELKQVEEQQRTNGGGALESLAVRLEEAGAAREKIELNRARLQVRAQALELAFSDRVGFEHAKAAAAQFVSSAGERESVLAAQRDDHVRAMPDLERRRNELRVEFESLKNRDGRVPVGHDRARNMIAQACGLRPQDLPFAAELMDVHPDYEQWRFAAEVTLGGIGLTMLMDERREDHVRRVIDGIQLDRRISFEGVDLGSASADLSDTRYISGRLVFKDSPFTGWVKERVSQPSTDHLCVDDPSQLGGREPKVTRSGQVSRGRRGAHGRNKDQRSVLGFSSDSRRSEIAGEVEQVQAAMAGHTLGRKSVDDEIAALRAKVEACHAVSETRWEDIDLDAADDVIAELQAQREALVDKSDVLGELQHRHAEVEQRLSAARDHRVRLADQLEELNRTWEAIVDRQDVVCGQRDHVERGNPAVLSAEDEQQLNAQLEELEPGVGYLRFERVSRRLKADLKEESARERKAAARTADTLAGIFEQYNEKWPDPNRGLTVDAYPEFEAIYDNIVRHGLFARQQAFKRRFQKWSGDDLKMLNDAYDLALTDIEERLDPVNEILSDLPFGAQADRLRIVVRRLQPEILVRFRKQLRALSSNLTGDWTDEQAEERFRELREFMTQLATPQSGPSDRDDLLDVRKHIEITACRVNDKGEEISTYSALGGKSGGESQELVAFIVGAALRYQLGDESRTKPRFAPVFLDEGFVKSDSEFAGRAVRAWRGLGFQLIVGAPLDKVTALEPHMDLNLSVTKRQDTGYSFVTPFCDAP